MPQPSHSDRWVVDRESLGSRRRSRTQRGEHKSIYDGMGVGIWDIVDGATRTVDVHAACRVVDNLDRVENKLFDEFDKYFGAYIRHKLRYGYLESKLHRDRSGLLA